jgi:hypothetical protein
VGARHPDRRNLPWRHQTAVLPCEDRSSASGPGACASPAACPVSPAGSSAPAWRAAGPMAASTARSAQSSLGLGFCRRSTATSWRSTSSPASFDAEERARSAIQPFLAGTPGRLSVPGAGSCRQRAWVSRGAPSACPGSGCAGSLALVRVGILQRTDEWSGSRHGLQDRTAVASGSACALRRRRARVGSRLLAVEGQRRLTETAMPHRAACQIGHPAIRPLILATVL